MNKDKKVFLPLLKEGIKTSLWGKPRLNFLINWKKIEMPILLATGGQP
jgi:hypothetical protein